MDKIIFPSDVQLGKYYKVPHVFCNDFYGVKGFIPINTPLHEDKDYINFEHLHFHCDWRFLNSRYYKSICRDINFPNYELRSEVSKVILTTLRDGKINTKGSIVYKAVRAKRKYANNTYFQILETPIRIEGWRKKIQDAFCGDHLRQNELGQYVCPHKGAIIDLTHVDENGNAVCPAHLLRFDVKTKKAI